MANESLAKILCHNLCCLIQSAYELDVTATFWGEEIADTLEPETEPKTDAFPIDAWAWI